MQLVVLVLLGVAAHEPAPAAGREEERVMVPVQEGGAELAQPWSETLKRNLNHIEDRPTRDRLRLLGQANTRQEVQG